MKQTPISQLEKKAKKIREEVLTMAYEGRSAHISSSLCIVDILTVLYWDILFINPKKPLMELRDRFILSKGHAVSALYATLAHRGFFSKDLLKTYGKNNTQLVGHPEFGNVPGIELSTGSLGHGLAVGAGVAYAAKINGNKIRSFVLLSDAECEEGSIWETALFAAHHTLSNLVAIIDYNNMQAFGRTNEVIRLHSLYDKLTAFGWHAIEIDGNNIKEVQKAFNNTSSTKPTAIICNTVAGKGVPFMENKLEWHYYNLDETLYKKALDSIKKKI